MGRKATRDEVTRLLGELERAYAADGEASVELLRCSSEAHRWNEQLSAIRARQNKLHAMLSMVLRALATDGELPTNYDDLGTPTLHICPSCNGAGCPSCNGRGCVKGIHASQRDEAPE